MNWRDRDSMDGYLWFGNWSGVQSGADAVPAATTLATSATIAYSPFIIEPDTAVIVKRLEMNLLDGTGGHDAAPVASVLIAQLRVIDVNRLQWVAMTKEVPHTDNFLFSLGKIWAKADEFEDPVFFMTDTPGQLTGSVPAGFPALAAPTAQVNYFGQPLALEWSRVFRNSAGVVNACSWQCSWSVDLYRRDPKRYPSGPNPRV